MASYDKLRKNNIPLHFSISLTNQCNLKCIHCLRLKDSKNELSTLEVKDIISQLSKAGCVCITLTGAEPFERKDFFEIAGFVREKGFALRILSNGTSIDEKTVNRLKRLKCELRITLYGITARTHDSITQVKGSFGRTMKGLKLLEKAKIPFDIAVVVLKDNFFEIEALTKELKRKKWKFRNDFVIYPGLDGSLDPLNLRITDEQLAYAVDKRLIDSDDGLSAQNDKKMALTDAARLNGYISSMGKIYPSFFLKTEVGNLRKDSFHNIWNHSKKLKMLRDLKVKDVPCSHCLYKYACNRDCGLVEDKNGHITIASEWCRIMEARKETRNHEKKD
ncbi:MAG: radical SAM protein [Candidatus Omnitrophica bacterium]|nr:radical SAM protein [Candidatus Omnitrophota bacterium]